MISYKESNPFKRKTQNYVGYLISNRLLTIKAT